MTTPDGWDRIRVEALDALRAEADTWRQGVDRLHEAKTAASSLVLGQYEMSSFATWYGLTELYQQTQERLVHLLGDTASHLASISAALTSAAANYEAEERQSAEALDTINARLVNDLTPRSQSHE